MGNRRLYDDTQDEIQAMVGDVNIFLNDPDSKATGEVEIMIAEPEARRKGLGREALLLMIDYARTTLDMTKFVAKISFSNSPSLALFQRLGFKETSRSEVFKEVTLEVASTQLTEYAEEHIKAAAATHSVYQPKE